MSRAIQTTPGSDLGTSPAPGPHFAAASLTPLSLRERDRAALRPLVAVLETQLSRLKDQIDIPGYTEASAELGLSWQRLVTVMALGEPPELRSCPHCGYRINRAATRCIECWKQSPAGPGEAV